MCGITLDHMSMWGYSLYERSHTVMTTGLHHWEGRRTCMVLNITQLPFPDTGIDTYMTHHYKLNTEETYLVTDVCQQFTPLLHPLFTSYHWTCLFLISTSRHKASVSSICTLIGMFPGSSPTFQLHQLPPCMCMVDVTRQILHHCWTSLSKQHTVDGFVMVHSWWMLFSNNRVLSAKAATQV